SDGVFLFQHLIWRGDKLGEPGPVPRLSYAEQVWPDPVTVPYSVARAALSREQVLSLVEVQFGRRPDPLLGVLPAKHLLELDGEESRVIHCRVSHPQSSRRVADQQCRNVAVRVGRVGKRIQPELLADQIYVLLLSREEQPAWPGMILFSVGLECRRRVL